MGFSDHEQLDDELGSDRELLAVLERETDPAALVEQGQLVLDAGDRLCARERLEPGLILFQAIVERFRGLDAPRLQKLSVLALLRSGEALAKLGRFEESVDANEAIFKYGEGAVAALDELSVQFEKANDRDRHATTLWVKAIAIGALDRRDETLAALDEVIDRFQNDTSPVVQAIVANAEKGREEVLATDGPE